ncbi:MAG: PGF-pre-PGF domain-containing protein [Methanophagales archaeon]|nr:PGF-pre-PGF domain-containing protein [Methanophagales archaeon]
MIKKEMKERSVKCERTVLVLLFAFAATALLVGTVTAVTHTEVESVTRYAPAGPAAGEEFEVTLRITGEVPLVVGIVETIPEGFSFPSSDVSSAPYKVSGQKIALAAIGETEIKYTVIAPSSGDGTFTGEWVDLLVLTRTLPEEEGKEGRWHTVAPEEGTTVIIGGGGAGTIEEEGWGTPTPTPFVPTVTKASRNIPVIEAGKEVATTFKDMDVSMITLKADADVSDVEVKVERVERTPDIPEPSDILYTYLDIEVENAGGAKIEGRVEFKVANSWIADNNIGEATVKLNRYDESGGNWNALTTSKVGEDDATVFFDAQTPGFSMFAVTGEKKVEVETAAAATPTPTPTTAVAAATPAAAPAATPTPSPTPASKTPGFEVIFAVVSLAVAYLVVFGKKGKRSE